ncbi:MAG TPA: hypothetical protein V6C72_14065, partial [Chroococcales cyanobacterium]
LAQLYANIADDPQVMLVWLPDQVHGAYICRNALDGMLRRPQFSRDVEHALLVNSYEPILPFGFLKDSLWQSKSSVKIARWDSTSASFKTVALQGGAHEPASRDRFPNKIWNAPALKEISTAGNEHTVMALSKSNTLNVAVPGAPRFRPTLIVTPRPPINCFNLDFVRLKLKVTTPTEGIKHPGVDLVYSNDLLPTFKTENRQHAELSDSSAEQELIFALRGLPDWSLGGDCKGFKIHFPEGSTVEISSMEIIDAPKLMPTITFDNCGSLGTKGYLHMGVDKQTAQITYDASKIPNASGIVFEITRPNLLFSVQNSTSPSTVTGKEIRQDGVSGIIQIDRGSFPALGLYEGRAWAVDSKGNRIGVAGDHMVFAIDS